MSENPHDFGRCQVITDLYERGLMICRICGEVFDWDDSSICVECNKTKKEIIKK